MKLPSRRIGPRERSIYERGSQKLGLDFVAITLPFDCFLLEAMNSLLVLQPTTLYACIC